MLSKLLCAKRRKSHNSTKYCESIIKSAGIKQMAIQHHRYDQHLSQFWKHLVTYFRTGRPIQTNNSNCMGGGRTTRLLIVYRLLSIGHHLLSIISKHVYFIFSFSYWLLSIVLWLLAIVYRL